MSVVHLSQHAVFLHPWCGEACVARFNAATCPCGAHELRWQEIASPEPEASDMRMSWGWARFYAAIGDHTMKSPYVLPNMDALVREAAELAYTTMGMRFLDTYVPWSELATPTQHAWCTAIEVALACALRQLFPSGVADAS